MTKPNTAKPEMAKPLLVLFVIKIGLYLSTASLVIFHPGIAVPFDRTGILLWFVIIPLEMIVAFLPAPAGKMRWKLLIALGLMLIVLAVNGGLGYETLLIMGAGVISFILNYLLFYQSRFGKLSALEPFFLAWITLRLLAFSRSGEEAAGLSAAITPFILVWAPIVFLLQSAVVFLCLNPPGIKGIKKEAVSGLLACLLAVIALAVILPPDFVKNAIVENLRQEEVDKMINESSDNGLPMSGRRRGGERHRPNAKGGELRGISESDWRNRARNRRGSGQGQPRQYAVMVVASEQEPVYMGNSFNGKLDPEQGFTQSPEEILNQLPAMRLFVTWFDNNPVFDLNRIRRDVFSLSTDSIKYLPYRPLEIQPTVLSDNSGPFRFIHNVTSNMHEGDPLELYDVPVRGLNGSERSGLAPYLELNLHQDDLDKLKEYLEQAKENWRQNLKKNVFDDPEIEINEYMENIIALLFSFSEHQYNLDYSNSISIPEIIEFLFTSKEGDCVHFSNSLALLGRIAGIPSRVVTGYLAAESLQTEAHLRGLDELQKKIPALQEFPFEDLYLVTNLHGHSWVQFYLPEYGWLDFESTSFAIPPAGIGDFNSWDVVIPIIEDNENRLLSNIRNFPWQAVLRTAGWILGAMLIGVYLLRYGRELMLSRGIKRGGKEGARSMYLLLLARLAADGKPIKPASKTATEYMELFPNGGEAFMPFAQLYSRISWRQFKDSAEMESCFMQLHDEYTKILLTEREEGEWATVKRIFSLRGLAYL